MQPCFLFVGDAFERDERHKLAKSLLIDVFRGQEVSEMTLMSLSHVIVCTATGQADLKLRHYAVLLKKSGTRVCFCFWDFFNGFLLVLLDFWFLAPPPLQVTQLYQWQPFRHVLGA